jgi:hypothetical protein
MNTDTGYAIGDGGTILKTINGGVNWISQSSVTTYGLSSIYFIRQGGINTGYIVGDGGTILKTTLESAQSDSACGTEGFANGTTAPSGWVFTNIGATYTSAANSGNLIPSLKFDATGDAVETAPVSDVSQLSFWIKGNSTDTASALLVEGYNGSTWISVDNISNLPTTGTTKTYINVGAYNKFRFTYTKSQGNIAFDDVDVICGISVGLAEIMNKNAINIYPNPVTDRLFITCFDRKDLNMQIYNILGELILQRKLNNSSNEIDISALRKGIYIVKIVSENGTMQQKIIKE